MKPWNRTALRARACTVAALVVGLVCTGRGAAGGAQETVAVSPSSGSAQTAYLDYRETDYSFLQPGLYFPAQVGSFQMEPDWAGRRVCRGVLDLGPRAEQGVPFVWDWERHKLYLDLNRNRDLTDDPAGVFSAPSREYGWYYQTFTNIHLSFDTPEGTRRLLIDLNLYTWDKRFRVSVACHSFWEGKVSLQGREWQVGFVEGTRGERGAGGQEYLLLRPWSVRGQPFNLQDGSLDGFPFSENLFFGQQAYHVKHAWVRQGDQLRLRIEFEGKVVETGELKLTGKYINRLLLRPSKGQGAYTVVLEAPGPVVKVPVGSYSQSLVTLKQGGVEVRRNQAGDGAGRSVVISAAKPALLACGGPLTNTVSANRSGRQLHLDYALVGAGGEGYRLTRDEVSKAPQFAVYRGDKQVGSGKFQFG